jgi:hypothetical protein
MKFLGLVDSNQEMVELVGLVIQFDEGFPNVRNRPSFHV